MFDIELGQFPPGLPPLPLRLRTEHLNAFPNAHITHWMESVNINTLVWLKQWELHQLSVSYDSNQNIHNWKMEKKNKKEVCQGWKKTRAKHGCQNCHKIQVVFLKSLLLPHPSASHALHAVPLFVTASPCFSLFLLPPPVFLSPLFSSGKGRKIN